MESVLNHSTSLGVQTRSRSSSLSNISIEVLQQANDLNTEEATSNLPMNESAIVDESSEIKEKPRKKAKRKRRRLCKPPKRRRTLHCPICLEELSLSVFATTVCRHQFCKLCMRRWIENQKVCPVCRKRLNNAWIRRTF